MNWRAVQKCERCVNEMYIRCGEMGPVQVLPAVGGGQSAGIGSEGEGGVGVGAASAVQAAGGDDGGRGLGEGEAREGARGRRLHRLAPAALKSCVLPSGDFLALQTTTAIRWSEDLSLAMSNH